MSEPKLIVVHSYGSRPEAELARGELEAAGIPAMIQSDSVGGMRDHMAWSGDGFQIVVREEDATDARKVLIPPAAGEISDADFPSDSQPPRPRTN
jgi:F420-dependent methylenetetrahydromethanopterin dehydrogenase